MLRGILAVQGNFKAHRAAQRPALWAFQSPRTRQNPYSLTLLVNTPKLVNVLVGVFYWVRVSIVEQHRLK